MDFAKHLRDTDRMSTNPLQARRKAAGLSQRELAERTGLSDETIRKAELGRHVAATSLRRIEEALRRAERLSEVPPIVEVIDKGVGSMSGRNVIVIRAAALGVEVETTFTDADDRSRVIAQTLAAMGIEGEQGDKGDS